MNWLLDWLEAELEKVRAAKAECGREGYRLSFIAYERARMFDRWLAEHDRQVAEKAYQEGYTSGWYRGWEDDGDHICHDNPFRKDKS
ncbi:hypothetical protein [Bifidobacterium myosotis]|uniref:Uncharacterized protein n=1 Tax=Bifidobacterium myosotis TaxID=1630166 RepID=A0A5M9ZIM5_9BIFI|nr:hypothetical protein [Bifidobacterium myosotis]KAA8827203.1 hypothetical protein EMO91_09120 [Bifidobacterium myosotis]